MAKVVTPMGPRWHKANPLAEKAFVAGHRMVASSMESKLAVPSVAGRSFVRLRRNRPDRLSWGLKKRRDCRSNLVVPHTIRSVPIACTAKQHMATHHRDW